MTNHSAALDIGAKLWSLCHVLRDDGVTYHQYLSELTYLLFLKMMKETGQEDRLKVWTRPKKSEPPVEQPGTRWDDLLNASAPERFDLYKEMLLDYGLRGRGAVQEIYANANTFITKPATLSKLVTDIDSLTEIRRDLMDKCNLHTILRLPTGIFYAQGVKTNVLFFTRGKTDKGNTKEVWVYDMRANMPQFGKRTPFTRDYFRTLPDAPAERPREKFEDVFGDDPVGSPAALAARQDTGATGRWRRFTREQITQRGDNLDISWLKDDSAEAADAQRDEPAMVARLLQRELGDAMAELRALLEELGEDPDAALDDLPLDEPQAVEPQA